MTQETVSKIHQAARTRAALQLDQETAYSAGCQRILYQLIRGCTSTCPRGCVSDSHLTAQLSRGTAPQLRELHLSSIRERCIGRSEWLRIGLTERLSRGLCNGLPEDEGSWGLSKRYPCIKAVSKASMYQAAIICTKINRSPCPL